MINATTVTGRRGFIIRMSLNMLLSVVVSTAEALVAGAACSNASSLSRVLFSRLRLVSKLGMIGVLDGDSKIVYFVKSRLH
jgi:hypothetical protein